MEPQALAPSPAGRLPGAAAAAPLRRAGLGRLSPEGRPSSRQQQEQRGPLLPPAAGAGTGPGRAAGGERPAVGEGPRPPRPGRSAERAGAREARRAAAQVSRAQRGKARLCEWCASHLTWAKGRFVFTGGGNGCSERYRRTIISVTLTM